MILGNQPSFKPQLTRNFLQKREYLELYCKGQEVPLSNGGFYQVYRGVIQLTRVKTDGQEIVVGWVTTNHAFGSLLNGGNSTYKAIALSDVYLRHYKSSEVARNSRLARLLVAEMSYRLLKSEQMVGLNLVRRVEERLKALLEILKEDLGYNLNDDRGIRLTARLTHQNLADSICTTRVTVTKILGEWQDRGLIEFDCDRHLIVKF